MNFAGLSWIREGLSWIETLIQFFIVFNLGLVVDYLGLECRDTKFVWKIILSLIQDNPGVFDRDYLGLRLDYLRLV